MWTFNFLHPKDGFGAVSVYSETSADIRQSVRVWVTGEWYLDRRDPDRRLASRLPERREVQSNLHSVIDALEKCAL